MQETLETWVQSQGWEDPMEEEMATHCSILAWEIPWLENRVGYRPWDLKEKQLSDWAPSFVIVNFWSIEPECRTVHKDCSSYSECNSVLLHHLWQKRATTQTSLDHFFKRVGRIKSSRVPEPVPSVSGMSEITACRPSPITNNPQVYHLPPPLPSPVSNSYLFTRCPLPIHCIPAVVLNYCTSQGTIS